MLRTSFFISLTLVVNSWVGDPCARAAESPKWTGKGQCRVLVRVEPISIGERKSDELVAQYVIDFTSVLKEAKISGQADLSTLQVHKYDDQTGEAEKFKPFDNAISPYDRPCRFDDDAVPDNYPDRASYASDQPNGKGPIIVRKRGGRLFNREMQNDHGKVNWVHTQQGKDPSFYAIYWDTKPIGETSGPSPAPWIGDVDVLRQKDGQLLTGLSHFTACAGDLNGDGLFDLVASAEKGDMMWFPNRGRLGEPRFDGCIMLTDEDGPIDPGWYGAPFIFDWDHDGLPDLLCGTSHNVILWWKNIGTRTQPKLSYKGFVQADGHKLEVPQSPVPEDTATIFKDDYFNQPWVGDWDGDGLPDILTGSYTTGQISFFRATGRDSKGVPILKYEGPIQADGKALDTVWAAAPFAADVDGDGKLDLITGAWFWSGIARPPEPGEADFLMYFHNNGSREHAQLARTAFPMKGSFPNAQIARPTIVDWNNDGLLDLLVSDAGGQCRIFINVGTKEKPVWDMHAEPMTVPWGFVRDFGFNAAMDMDGDGRPELLMGDQFHAYEGSPYSPHTAQRGVARVDGKPISYPGPGYGDPYSYATLCDWDHDGIVDLLWGTQQGNLFLHRGLSRSDPYSFAPGVKLKLTTGEDLRVGPPVVDSPKKATDFTILQGSRIVTVVADFDKDGIDDLAVTETFGNIFIFRNTRAGGVDTIAPGVLIGKVPGGGRTEELTTVDWDEDGKPDLMSGQTAAKPGTIYLNRSKPGNVRFDAPTQPLADLPFLFWGPSFKPMDWNGDGDEDFLISSEFFMFYAEKSFLLHGYQRASLISALQQREQGGGS